MDTSIKINKIAIKYGIIASLGLVSFFVMAHETGYADVLHLRLFNALILFPMIFLALRKFVKETPSQEVYLRSLGLGLRTAAMAVIPFAVFLFIYLQVDTGFMTYLKENALLGSYLSPFIISFVILFEGMMSGALFSYISMQYMKKYASAVVVEETR